MNYNNHPPDISGPRRKNFTLFFWLFTGILSLVRLFIIGKIGLGDDEAHYYAYSRFLDLSYFDHPPLIGYIIKISTAIFGKNEFAVRFPTVVLFALSSYFLYLVAKKLIGEKKAFYSVILLNIMPVFGLLGSIFTVPDAPLAFFWSLYIYIIFCIYTGSSKYLWYLSGAVLGFALLSKYNAILLLPSAVIFLLLAKDGLRQFKKKEPYIALLVSLAIFAPVILWNTENDFASFGFQLRHGFGSGLPQFSLDLLGKSLGAQAAYISPFLFIFLYAALGWYIYRAVKTRETKYILLASFSMPTLFLFNSVSSFNAILPHWPAMGYFLLPVALVDFISETRKNKPLRIAFYFSVLFGILLSLFVLAQALFQIVPADKLLAKSGRNAIEDGVSVAQKIDITNELYGWKEAASAIEKITKEKGGNPFIFTHRHYIASQLKFYLPDTFDVICLSDRVDAYDFWQRDINRLNGKNGIFVTDNRFMTNPANTYPFESWSEPQKLEFVRNGKIARVFWFYYGRNFDIANLEAGYTAQMLAPRLNWKSGLRKYDYKFFIKINKDRHLNFIDHMMWFITNFGNGILVIMIIITIQTRNKNKFWKEMLFVTLFLLFGGLFVQLIKKLVGRARPLTIFGEGIHILGDKLYWRSFPSGHTQFAFSCATYLAYRLKKEEWLFFFMAAIIGVSRIYVGAHFPLDVLAGALVGIGVTLAAIRLFKR